MPLRLNGVEVDDVRLNGIAVDAVVLNGTGVYQRFQPTHTFSFEHIAIASDLWGFSKSAGAGWANPEIIWADRYSKNLIITQFYVNKRSGDAFIHLRDGVGSGGSTFAGWVTIEMENGDKFVVPASSLFTSPAIAAMLGSPGTYNLGLTYHRYQP